MDQSAHFLLREDTVQKLFQADMTQLPDNTVWMPELGIAPLGSYLDNTGPLMGLLCPA